MDELILYKINLQFSALNILKNTTYVIIYQYRLKYYKQMEKLEQAHKCHLLDLIWDQNIRFHKPNKSIKYAIKKITNKIEKYKSIKLFKNVTNVRQGVTFYVQQNKVSIHASILTSLFKSKRKITNKPINNKSNKQLLTTICCIPTTMINNLDVEKLTVSSSTTSGSFNLSVVDVIFSSTSFSLAGDFVFNGDALLDVLIPSDALIFSFGLLTLVFKCFIGILSALMGSLTFLGLPLGLFSTVFSGLFFLINKGFFTIFFGGLVFFSRDNGLPRFLFTGFISSFDSDSSVSVSTFTSTFIDAFCSLTFLLS
ncbi:hypothetical protein AGLY_011380 [Aphis glycines]|uniref:Uncharacterized protein n=1 Tax=Aphis glycines TaxID=307491 RepID=A0A6G0TDV8_APHGL|nr:hypothetical protein AGLY_011380 [Aphis glycines]